MNGWSWHRTRILFLAVLLGMGLSFVQGGVIAAEMAVAADGAQHGTSGCYGCGGGDDETDAGMCLSVCGTAAQGLLAGEPAALLPASEASFELARLHLGGRSHNPDHGPPKTLTVD